MAANSGVDGKVTLAGSTVAKIAEWSIDLKHNVVDQTAFTESWETKLKGLKGASGSFKGSFDYSDTNGQVALHSAFLAGNSVALKMYYSSTGYYDLLAFIDGIKPANKVDGKVEIEYSYVATGSVAVA